MNCCFCAFSFILDFAIFKNRIILFSQKKNQRLKSMSTGSCVVHVVVGSFFFFVENQCSFPFVVKNDYRRN